MISRIFPVLVLLLSLIHRVAKHSRIVLAVLTVAFACAWISPVHARSSASGALSYETLEVFRCTITVLFAAYVGLHYFARQVQQNLKSPVRALYDCLKLPPAPGEPKNSGSDTGSFRFRRASTDDDIRHIAELCAREPKFVAANPTLQFDHREQLYKNWFDASPHSFYMLEHQSAQGTVVVAVSIILPLTADGATRLWNGDAGVLELAKSDITTAKSDTVRILLDTLFIAKDFRGIATHKKYPWALVLKHLSAFIDSKSHQVQAFVLPDVPSTRKILRQVGFEGPHSTEKERGLYRIKVVKRLSLVPESAVNAIAFMPAKPTAKLVALLLEAEVCARILQNIDICRRWELQDA